MGRAAQEGDSLMDQWRHVVVLALGVLAATAGCKPRPPGPKLAIEVAKRDIGSINAGESKEVSFPLRNEGAGTLHIQEVVVSCGCLTPDYPHTLASGASGEVKVRFEPQMLWSGKMEKTLKVKTDDPLQPEAQLTINCQVIPYIRIEDLSRKGEQGSPVVIQYSRGESFQRDLTLTPREGTSITMRDARSSSPLLKAGLSPGKARGSYRLHLAIGPVKGPGDVTETVQVTTSAPHMTVLPVVVVLLAKAGPVVSPRDVYISSLDAGEKGKEVAKMQVFTRTGHLKVLGIDTGNTGLLAEVQPKTAGQFYEVVLRYAGGWKSGPVEGKIRVRTDDQTAPVLVVPFHAMVR